jgi:predicted DNA-binding transcriptional regulator AlpA
MNLPLDRDTAIRDDPFGRNAVMQAITDAGGVLTVADIARRWRISKARADELSKRPDFPKPLMRIGRSALYVGTEIDAWRATPRRPGRPGRSKDAV